MNILIIVLQVYMCGGIWTNHGCQTAKPTPTYDPVLAYPGKDAYQREMVLLEVQSEARKLQPYRISTALHVAEVHDACLSGKNTITACRKVALKTVKELQTLLLKAEKALREEERLRLQRTKISRSTKK